MWWPFCVLVICFFITVHNISRISRNLSFSSYFPIQEVRCNFKKKHVVAGANFWMSNSDGLGSSSFCWKAQGTRPRRKNVWKGVYFPPGSAFQPLMLYFVKTLLPFCTLIWLSNKYFSRHGKGIKKENESTRKQLLLILLTIKIRNNLVLVALLCFPVKNDNSKKWATTCSP